MTPCTSSASEDLGEVLERLPTPVAMQDKTVADLANELSPIPNNEPYTFGPQQQELVAFMPKYENDSDDETLRAQSGDESSESRNASESEGEDADIYRSRKTKMPVKPVAGANTEAVSCATRSPPSEDGDKNNARAWVRRPPAMCEPVL